MTDARLVRQEAGAWALTYHRGYCRHVKDSAVEVTAEEVAEAYRAQRSGNALVRFEGRQRILWLCGLCRPHAAPPLEWPPR